MNNESSYSAKVNFVDNNNVFIGYDMEQDCCEYADWFIAPDILMYKYDMDLEGKQEIDYPNYNFDPYWNTEIKSNDLDAGSMVIFKLASENKPDLYLHIFNAHNGYYGHGFEVKHSGTVVKSGIL